MLQSVKLQQRQSALRQELAALVGKDKLDENETRSMANLEAEYGQNEGKYRAALIVEDEQRAEAKGELETRSDREYADIVSRFELRQVANFLDTGDTITGETAEIVSELRNKGSYRGVPVPFAALELRSGETVASGVPDPVRTMPTIVRLFPSSVAARMGVQLLNLAPGAQEWPVVTSSVAAGWADGELANVAAAQAFATTDKVLQPNHNFGVQMVISRKSLRQSGGVEMAVRNDMNSAIGAGLDKAIFLGTGANGQPLGVVAGQSTYAYTTTAASAEANWSMLRSAIVAFITGNAANALTDVKVLMRPEVMDHLDDQLIDSTAVSEWDLVTRHLGVGNIVFSSNAVAAPTGTPKASTVLLTTSAGGVAPIFAATWGNVDLIRDPYAGAAAGSLKLTALLTADVNISRKAQIQTLTGVQSEAAA